MAERHTSLSLAALKTLLVAVDRAIAIYEQSHFAIKDLDRVGRMLRQTRRQLAERIARHPDNRR
jgi:hypothetical protein